MCWAPQPPPWSGHDLPGPTKHLFGVHGSRALLPPCGRWGTTPAAHRKHLSQRMKRDCPVYLRWERAHVLLVIRLGSQTYTAVWGGGSPKLRLPSWPSPGCAYGVCPIYPRRQGVCALYLVVMSGLQVYTKGSGGHPAAHAPPW